MPDGDSSMPGSDPFSTFWTDFFGKMSGGGFTPPSPPAAFSEQMRKSMFGAMAEYADEFMRSEQFLQAMKQGMDNSLALKQQIDQLLTKNLQSAQMPTIADTDNIALLLRGMEERMVGKLDELSERVEVLEGAQDSDSTKKQTKTKTASRKR
jgi:hypothetical protein